MADERDQGNLIDDPVIVWSARKHGVADDDMTHAYRHPSRVFDLDDLTMLIGPRHLQRAHRGRPRHG